MPVDRSRGLAASGRFARHPPFSFSTIPAALVAKMVDRRVGRNGWAVMVALCRKLYEGGCFGMSSSKEMAAFTGLSAYQIARGMTELREKGFIVPLIVKDADGRRRPDRSSSGHVARYCVARSIWETVELCGGGVNGSREARFVSPGFLATEYTRR